MMSVQFLEFAICTQVFWKKFRELPSVVGSSPARGQHLNFVQGDPSACGKGYVDISSDSYRGYPETELMPT